MSNVARVAGQAANTLSKPLQVEDVFSTYLYKGTGADQTITNGIDLAGEGGLVWVKGRSGTAGSSAWGGDIGHNLFDSTAPQKPLNSALNNARTNFGAAGVNFTGTGFTVGYNGYNDLNYSSFPYVSWSFRKAEKFFDIVTYTGDGTTNRQISHNLGSAPGCIIVKRTNALKDWAVYHRSTGNTHYAALNTSETFYDWHTWWQDTDPTSTNFTVGNSAFVNANGDTYVAYIFAHNDGDGDFGPDGNADIIKCGSYTGDGTEDGSNVVDLGFEPQWVLVKNTSSSWGWVLQDNMRGLTVSSNSEPFLSPDSSAAESSFAGGIDPTSTGFALRTDTPYLNTSGDTYIYIAIRRGTKVPESATEVFAIDEGDGVGAVSAYTSGFPVDFAIDRTATGTSPNYVGTRLLQGTRLQTNDNNAEASESAYYFDYMEGWRKFSRAAGNYSWMWKRAPKYFDVVAYTGNQTAGRTVTHNLGAVPEMMWIKSRNGSGSSYNWICYLSALGTTHYAILNETYINPDTSNVHFNGTAPTSTVFSLGTSLAVNRSGYTYVAYLFASLAGISKVSSVTHSGTTNVDCGFTSGARFVLLKRTDADDNWYVWDSERGIVSGNDPYLLLNTTAAEVTNTDYIDPLSSGFTITSSFTAGDYAFYALA